MEEEQEDYVITEIVSITKQRKKVILDTKDTLLLFTNELERLGLQTGMQLPAAEFKRLRDEVVFGRARKKALDLLMRSDRSEKELTGQLMRYGFSEELSLRAVAYVKEYHYVDDERYAKNYVEFRASKKSNRQLRMELSYRGIAPEQIDQMLQERKDGDILERLVKKKLCTVSDVGEKTVQKLKNSLYRKGFSFTDIERVVEQVLEEQMDQQTELS